MRQRRSDRAVERAWRVTLASLIFAAALVGVGMVYNAFFAGIAARWPAMGLHLLLASALAWGVWWLATRRDDLVGER
jgi:hypothetical protein